MATISIVVPGPPVAQGRPRFSTAGGFPRAYDPAKSRAWKKHAAFHMLLARQAVGAAVLTGPVRVDIVAMFACPKGDYRVRNPASQRRHVQRPDAENVAKCALDSATGVIFDDDSLVCDLRVQKFICAQGDEPRVEMTVTSISEEETIP